MNKQMAIPLSNSPYSSPYTVVGKEAVENLYLEQSQSSTGKVQYYYVSIPGLKQYIAKSSAASCRGLYRTGTERVFTVFSNELYEIYSNGTKTLRGTITTYSGSVQMADNTYQMVLVDGQYGYILDFATNTFSKIDEETFPNGATHVTCIDNYFLANKPNTIIYQWSKLNDGTIWNPLDFATKEGQPDNIVALKDCRNQLYVFGQYSTEVHYNTGDTSTQVWQRYEGGLMDIGCTAPYSIAKIESHLFWLGTDKNGNNAVWANDNLTPVKISTRGIEQLILSEAGQNVSNAIGFSYAQNGHQFYIIQFIGSELTLAYDIVTKTWHRRTNYSNSTGNTTRWAAQWTAFAFGRNLAGDRNSNFIYEIDDTYYINDEPDGGTSPIKRVMNTPIIQSNQKRLRHKSFQIIFQQGVGLSNNTQLGFGVNPQCLLYCSDDNGESFGAVRRADIGAQGNYTWRTRFLSLGHSRNRMYKIIVTDPIECILVGIIADVEELGF